MPDIEAIIRRAAAPVVRLIEATDVLLEQKLNQHELVTLLEARPLAVQRLRQLAGELDPAITAQIVAASMKVLGPVQNVQLN